VRFHSFISFLSEENDPKVDAKRCHHVGHAMVRSDQIRSGGVVRSGSEITIGGHYYYYTTTTGPPHTNYVLELMHLINSLISASH